MRISRLFVLIGILAIARGAAAQIRGLFLPVGHMTKARAGHSATLLLDGTVLIAGGDGSHAVGADPAGRTAELYDPTTGTFTPTGQMIEPRYVHTATLLPDGKVLIAGGRQDTTAELYDPSTHQFSLTGPMRVSQHWFMATLLNNGKVLVAGDVEAELYDPATGSFTAAAPYAARSGNTVTLLADGQVLFVGDEPAQIYDPRNDRFTTTGLLAAAGVPGVEEQTATLLNNGKVLITGGENDEFAPAGLIAAAELYDPNTGSFTPTGAMHSPRAFHAAALLSDGSVLVVGGEIGKVVNGEGDFAGSSATAELYDPSSGTFAEIGSMNAPRSLGQATLLTSGDVLITGGFGDCSSCVTGNSASAEIYHRPARRRIVRR